MTGPSRQAARSRNPFVRFPGPALILALLLALPLALKLSGFQIRADGRALLQGDQRNLASYAQVQAILGDTETVVVSLAHPRLFSREGVETVRRLSEAFLQQPGVTDVRSLTHSTRPVRRGASFEFVPLVPPNPGEADLAALRSFCLDHPLVRNVMVAADGKHTLLMVTYAQRPATAAAQDQLRRSVAEVLAPFEALGLECRVLALSLIEAEIRATLQHDLRRFLPIVALLLVGVLWLTFRSWRLVLLVLMNQAAVLALLPGVIEAAGFRLNVFSVLVFPLLTGIHLTLLTHLYAAFHRAIRVNAQPDAALRLTLAELIRPATFATLTTLVGLLSLLVGGVAPTREFGLVAALGLGLVHAMTFGPGLALLALLARRPSFVAALARRDAHPSWIAPIGSPESPAGGSTRSGSGWSEILAGWVRRWRWGILAGAGTAMILAGLDLRAVRTDIRPTEFLSPQSSSRQALEELNRTYGGVNVVQIEFDTGAANGVNRLPFLRYLEAVHAYAAAQPGFSGVYSYPQLLGIMNELWEGERAGTRHLPESPLTLGLFVLAMQAYDFPFLQALTDREQRIAYLVLRTPDLSADRYLRLIHDVVARAQQSAPPGVAISAARGLQSILEADRRIVRSQVASAGLTALAITLLLGGLWRSARLAMIALLTNAVPVAAVLAAARHTGVTLNSITVMVAAIALGIAVDNTIHFITRWRDARLGGATEWEAIGLTLSSKGPAILGAGAILATLFITFAVFSFPPLVQFGLLSAAALFGALVAVFVFLPVLLGSSIGGARRGARPRSHEGDQRSATPG